MKINIGELSLEVTETRHATVTWGDAEEICLEAFTDKERKIPYGNRKIAKSGQCRGQIINLVKVLGDGDDSPPGRYYFSASVGEKSADFEWWRPETISNSPIATPVKRQIENPPAPPPPSGEQTELPTTPPSLQTPTQNEDPGAKNAMVFQEELKKLGEFIGSVSDANSVPTKDQVQGLYDAANKLDKAIKANVQAFPESPSISECNIGITGLMLRIDRLKKLIPPAPVPPVLESRAMSQTKTPTKKFDDSPARSQEDGGHIPIASRVEKLEKRADQTDKDLHAVGSLAAKGINELTQAIAGLRPATDPKSGASGNGGNNGGGGASGGGKASADKNPPKSTDRSWIMLLLGILGTLLLLIGVGGWIVSSLLGGWILGSKAPTAGFMPAMVPHPVVMITNAVTPPPAVQQAVPSTTVASPEDLAKIADEIKAIRAGQAEFLRKDAGGLIKQPAAAKSGNGSNGGVSVSGNVVGNGNTVNYYLPAHMPSRNESQETTPQSRVTSGDTTSTDSGFQTIRSSEDRPAHTARHWSPTLMTGFVCVPVAADGSGSEGFWVYQNLPVPGQTT